ncbi:MAG: DUF1850 domain-containing protein [Treponema sp.]|jgi:hypothetical protein|nr:DUF1850 domain-containing protein [Treponema sp.]
MWSTLTVPRLSIRDAESGRIYGIWPQVEQFSIEFVHSVHQSPVSERFQVEGNRIRPLAARFFSFGAGMQAELGEGQKMSRDGDALVITGFTQSFKELNYIVGTVSDHILYIHRNHKKNKEKTERISLRDLCGKNAHIVLRISRTGLAGFY